MDGACWVCFCVAHIHSYSTLTSRSFESMRWNACVHRLDLGLFSHSKESGGNGVRAYVNSKGKKSLLPEKFSSKGGSNPPRRIKQDSVSSTLPPSSSSPIFPVIPQRSRWGTKFVCFLCVGCLVFFFFGRLCNSCYLTKTPEGHSRSIMLMRCGGPMFIRGSNSRSGTVPIVTPDDRSVVLQPTGMRS